MDWTRFGATVAAWIAAGALVAGCASQSGERPGGATDAAAGGEGVNTGLDNYVEEDEAALARRIEEDAAELARLQEELDRTWAARRAARDAGATDAAAPGAASANDVGDLEQTIDRGAARPAEPPPTLEQMITRLTAELAARLRDQSDAESAPLHAMASLAALEVILPGISEGYTPRSGLTPREVEALEAWREMLRAAHSGVRNAQDPSALASAVRVAAERMAAFEPFTIGTAALCTRVEGFGRYTEMPGRTILAGRRHPAIVYVEALNFAHKAGTGPDGEAGWVVELTQDLSLYHDADGLLAWKRPEQEIVDFSRQRRRDFFVVQRIELPETLTVGSYRLKVTMRDRNAPGATGGGGAVAEWIIPIDVVADATLTRPLRR